MREGFVLHVLQCGDQIFAREIGYLDAIRKVFSEAPEKHVGLIPEDIGLGPYDSAYKARQKR